MPPTPEVLNLSLNKEKLFHWHNTWASMDSCYYKGESLNSKYWPLLWPWKSVALGYLLKTQTMELARLSSYQYSFSSETRKAKHHEAWKISEPISLAETELPLSISGAFIKLNPQLRTWTGAMRGNQDQSGFGGINSWGLAFFRPEQ